MLVKEPKVSIVIPVYNGSEYMREAIDSALSQTYGNVEVVVVNDGSNDQGKTDSIARSYGKKIRYFVKENGGVSTALNLGISKMDGEYFSWLSHDDVYSSDKIKNQIKCLSAIKMEKYLICCQTSQIDKNSAPVKSIKKSSIPKCGTINWHDALGIMLKRGAFGGCAFLIPKNAFDEVGLFDETLRYNQDAIMWYKLLLAEYNIVFNKDFDVMSRVHNSQLSQTGKEVFRLDNESISDYLIDTFSMQKEEYKLLFLYAKRMAIHNDSKIVKKCLVKAKEKQLFSLYEIIQLKFIFLWGKVRPLVKRMYYKLFKGIKTQ